jgi:hypothetical protein
MSMIQTILAAVFVIGISALVLVSGIAAPSLGQPHDYAWLAWTAIGGSAFAITVIIGLFCWAACRSKVS